MCVCVFAMFYLIRHAYAEDSGGVRIRGTAAKGQRAHAERAPARGSLQACCFGPVL